MAAAPDRRNRRLTKELQELQKHTGDAISVESADSFAEWVLRVRCSPETIYAGEIYHLRFRFSDRYPIESPEVVFLEPSPVHPHIYSNGHICLNILGKDWSPALSVESVCMSIISMLSSCRKKERPKGDADYSRRYAGVSPKQASFLFHDDDV
eukprot:tig00021073_g18027.t1